MKPITQDIADKNVDYVVNGITNVIQTFGKRDPGSEGERKANEHFAKELENYADTVKMEEFKLHADAFMGWLYFEIAFVFIAIACMWFNLNIVALVLMIAALALVVLQLVFYKHVTAPFFPVKTSTNVFASVKPTGEVKRRIVFCGHTDAAFEWGWLNLGGFPLFLGTVLAAFGALFAIIILSIVGMVLNGFGVGLVGSGGYQIALIVVSCYSIPAVALLIHFSNRNMVVDGANDNLTACLTSIAVLKTMKEEGITFENTEVCALMAGSEEAGLRGAMAFAKAHKEELANDPAETIFIVLETLREVDHLTIYNKDMNGVVKVDPQVCRLLQIAGEEALGRTIPMHTVTLGATDSAAFANAGLKSSCFAALNHELQDYYHTRLDSFDNLSKECLDLSYKVCMKTLEIYDRDGLPTV